MQKQNRKKLQRLHTKYRCTKHHNKVRESVDHVKITIHWLQVSHGGGKIKSDYYSVKSPQKLSILQYFRPFSTLPTPSETGIGVFRSRVLTVYEYY